MHAVVARGVGKDAIEEVPVPQAPPKGLLLKTEGCGICAGDIKAYQGGDRFWGSEEFSAYCEPPFIPGHEFIGRICALGKGYEGPFAVGDRVAVEQVVPCGHCDYCKRGWYWLCGPHDVFGFKKYLNGGFAPYVALPENARVFSIPEQLPLKTALLIEPFACSHHAVERAHIEDGDVLVIAGAGPLGLGMIGWAKKTPAKAVIALDMNEKRLTDAKRMGADYCLNPAKDDVDGLISSLTNGLGCDAYIEATGHPSGVTQGLRLLRKAGKMVEFSVFTAPTTSDWGVIGDVKELTIYGCSLSPNAFPSTIEALADGSLPSEGIVTHLFPLNRFEEAFEVCHSGEGIKIGLLPEE